MNLLLESTIKISAVVGLALAANVALRGRSAAVRHWVLASALCCAAVGRPTMTPTWRAPGGLADTAPPGAGSAAASGTGGGEAAGAGRALPPTSPVSTATSASTPSVPSAIATSHAARSSGGLGTCACGRAAACACAPAGEGAISPAG